MLAIIPARGGSKGVLRKNIKFLAGKPLIYYTIKAAQNSNYISRIVVSTDDNEIAETAKSLGAEVPFLRPKELATDTAKAIDAYLYSVERLEREFNESIKNFVVLLPTSPLRTSLDIDNAIELFHKKNAKTVISVVEAEHPPTWYKIINEDGILKDYFENVNNNMNRQEAERTYLPNGAIYVFNYDALKKNYNYYNDKTYPYIMCQTNSIDIDSELDFEFAEYLILKNSNINNYW